ncbi:YqjF family protein [Streptomyces sp. MS06]|uniref:YqjF family protein n=1 Tax=Streptomyces sp. MS06 TaxID=3385974 RepID=UPI00399FD14E
MAEDAGPGRGPGRASGRTTGAAEDVTPVPPPRPVRRAVTRQYWRDLVFLHWQADPFEVARLLPAGTAPDLHHGRAYVGLVFFRMQHLSLGPTPALPYLGEFNEVNVRLYSRDRQGRRAVVFRSLDCDRLLPVLAARAGLGLPYRWSAISRRWFDHRLIYRVRGRRGARPAARVWIDVDDTPATPSPLEQFLTNRWGLHARVRGTTYHMPQRHPAWTFRRCALLGLDESLVAAAGLTPVRGAPASVLYAPGVPVRFGPPQPLNAGAAALAR